MNLIQVNSIILHLPKAMPSPTLIVDELLCIDEDFKNLECSSIRIGKGASVGHGLE